MWSGALFRLILICVGTFVRFLFVSTDVFVFLWNVFIRYYYYYDDDFEILLSM